MPEPVAIPFPRRPALTPEAAERLLQERYGLLAVARPLPSDRDQNFLVSTDAGPAYVLKIANAAEDRAVLEAQHGVLRRLAAHGVPAPAVCETTDGAAIHTLAGSDGAVHLVRMLTYLPGVPLARVRPHAPGLLVSLGRFLGRLDAALDGVEAPAARRHLPWDVQHAVETVRERLPDIAEMDRRALVERFVARFEAETLPRLADLRRGVIHGDANDHNVLVDAPGAPERAVVGCIDFGDLVHTVIVAEPAVAAAYAMLDKPDPLAAAAYVVAGYHAAFPLREEEWAMLFPLLCMRLCISVAMSARQKRQEPDNAYLTVSERPAWDLLHRLADVHPRWATYRFRHACGLPPSPRAAAVVAWLREHAEAIAPVVRPDPRTAPVLVFDFSVGSPDWDHGGLARPMLAAQAIRDRMDAAGAAVGVGRYDEARLVYAGPQYRTGEDEAAERRTVHLGLDLFQDAGAPVFAPLAGVVHSVRDNDRPLDYGPTLILRHDVADGLVFYTLFGHLGRDVLEIWRPGMAVEQGRQIGVLGTPAENGGWAPHLHLQLIVDVLDRSGDFPGVAAPSERAVWRSVCPDPNLLVGIPEAAFPEAGRTVEELLAARAKHLGPSLSVSYRQPLKIVRGFMQYLYDDAGRAYLDAVNNVPHVGHCHPRVVRAAQQQMAVLNTNTRYLHDHLVRYAERLTALLPSSLSVCYVVNSGSEANDLALRLAYAHTGQSGVVVLDGAYHGNLSSLVAISPYKFDGPGGSGAPPTVHKVVMPDPYRGPYRGDGPEVGAMYARHVHDAVAAALASGHGTAAFVAESLLSCGGQIELPEGYLQEAYRAVHDAGGICVADEVQVGFGRVGTHVWGFETQGVVPDVVTLGKPIGNGHPLGAVVTTPAIAASFANGMEYFNTYGGNPVSCAVGLAVLDVLEAEDLQEHARRVGAHLKAGLAGLRERHPVVGDVRGRGLFLGVELVRDRETLEPAAAEATYVANRMRDHGVLLSTDGPLHNVLKIKPPLVFTAANADRLVRTLDAVLAEDAVRHGKGTRDDGR